LFLLTGLVYKNSEVLSRSSLEIIPAPNSPAWIAAIKAKNTYRIPKYPIRVTKLRSFMPKSTNMDLGKALAMPLSEVELDALKPSNLEYPDN
jgi:hypothetical protein